MNPRTQKIRERVEKQRASLWPDVSPEQLWHRKRSNGFVTVPRTMPLMMAMMDTLTKGKPVSSTYLELWCRGHDEAMLILIGKEHEYATASGFSGERAVSTWQGRIDALAKLGFIRLAAGPGGPRSYALLLNPYHVLKKLRPQFEEFLWNSFTSRVLEIGATDMDEAPAPESPTPKKGKGKTVLLKGKKRQSSSS